MNDAAGEVGGRWHAAPRRFCLKGPWRSDVCRAQGASGIGRVEVRGFFPRKPRLNEAGVWPSSLPGVDVTLTEPFRHPFHKHGDETDTKTPSRLLHIDVGSKRCVPPCQKVDLMTRMSVASRRDIKMMRVRLQGVIGQIWVKANVTQPYDRCPKA